MNIPPILLEVLCSAFVLTGYLGQEDDLYTGREALIFHLLGGGSNRVTYLARKNESGEYPISFF